MQVLYNFKGSLDYSSLYRSVLFSCHDTTRKKIFSIEKLNLTWNKHTNFNKLGPLYWIFQIALSDRGGLVNLHGGILLSGDENLTSDFDHSNLIPKLKTTFCKYWTLIQIKISMTCVYKEYEGKINMVQERWLQPKMKLLLDYNLD